MIDQYLGLLHIFVDPDFLVKQTGTQTEGGAALVALNPLMGPFHEVHVHGTERAAIVVQQAPREPASG